MQTENLQILAVAHQKFGRADLSMIECDGETDVPLHNAPQETRPHHRTS